uniref:Secreted protein n=1 Tax=Anguilla anguilla TaxID=7936 RepID=A0A0E9RRU4_ANGAN
MYTFWGLAQTVVQLFHIAFSSLYSMLQSSEVGLYKWFCTSTAIFYPSKATQTISCMYEIIVRFIQISYHRES